MVRDCKMDLRLQAGSLCRFGFWFLCRAWAQIQVKGPHIVSVELERADMEDVVQKHTLDLSSFSPNLHRGLACEELG